MNNLKHDPENNGGVNHQPSEKPGVFLSNQRVSWLVSAIILFCSFVFIAGYFWGKKKAAEKFYDKIEQDSFADHIYYSMCSMYDNGTVAKNNGGGTEAAEPEKVAVLATSTVVPAGGVAQGGAPAVVGQSLEAKVEATEEKESVQYYAELAGFGTEAAAKKYVDQLKAKHITVLIKKRHGKTSRGRVATWYQVVSETLSNKKDLMALVDDISALKGLKNVRIITC